jgi:hypothetical protein
MAVHSSCLLLANQDVKKRRATAAGQANLTVIIVEANHNHRHLTKTVRKLS